MATTNYLFTDSDGIASPSSATVDGGGYRYYANTPNWQYARTFTGAKCVARLYVTAGQTLQISFDAGSTWTDVTINTFNAFADHVLWDSTEATRSFILRHVSGASNAILFNTTSSSSYTFQVTGAAPSSAPHPGYGTQYDVLAAPFSTYSRQEGEWTTNANPKYLSTQWVDDQLRFSAPNGTTEIWLWGYGAGNKIGLQIDGIDSTVLTLPNDSAYYWRKFTGLSGAHTYSLYNANGSFIVHSIMLVGGTLTTAQPAAFTESIGFMGDSITRGVTGTGDSTLGFAHRLGQSTGKLVINRAYNGAMGRDMGTGGVEQTTYSGERDTHIARITSALPKPKVVFWAYGFNDWGGGLVTSSQWISSDTAAMNKLLAGLDSDAKIRVVPIWPQTAFTPINSALKRAVINAYTQQGIDACNSPSQVTLISENDLGGYTGEAGQNDDGYHPNASGNARIASGFLPLAETDRTILPPTASLAANGTALTATFSEIVLGSAGLFVRVEGALVSYAISGIGTTRLLTLSDAAYEDQEVTFDYVAGDIRDEAGNALGAISGRTVINGSTQEAPTGEVTTATIVCHARSILDEPVTGMKFVFSLAAPISGAPVLIEGAFEPLQGAEVVTDETGTASIELVVPGEFPEGTEYRCQPKFGGANIGKRLRLTAFTAGTHRLEDLIEG